MTPAQLPDGDATVDLGVLMRHLTRAQDPNLPGFRPNRRTRGYVLWPFYRYGPLLSRHEWLCGLSVVDRLDPRKKSIVAEDVGLAFAGHAMGLLGALPFMTKWEIGQKDRRSALAAMLGKPAFRKGGQPLRP